MSENNKPTQLVIDDTVYETSLTEKFKKRTKYLSLKHQEVRAFIPGLILDIMVKEKQRIKKGERLMILEAMKMNNFVIAPKDGIVRRIYIEKNQKVVKGQLLILMD